MEIFFFRALVASASSCNWRSRNKYKTLETKKSKKGKISNGSTDFVQLDFAFELSGLH